MHYKRIHDFLTGNKIIFETITASSLSMAALVVSISQCSNAVSQNSLLALQTVVAEAQALPVISVEIQQILNDNSNFVDNHTISISNEGGPVHNLNVETAYFLLVKGTKDITDSSKSNAFSPKTEDIKFEIPVPDYYFFSQRLSISKGELYRISGDNNNRKYNHIVNEARNLSEADKFLWFDISEDQYAHINYDDILQKHHDDYIHIINSKDNVLMDHKDGNLVFKKLENVSSLSRMDQLSGSAIIRMADEHIKAISLNQK